MSGGGSSIPNAVDDPFSGKIRQLAEAGRLCCLQCADGCGVVDYAARICPKCAGPLEVSETKGFGEIYSFVIYHTKYDPELDPPYTTILVELDEGCRLTALLEDDGSGAPTIGDPVSFKEIQNGRVWFQSCRSNN
ncbi:MULTISPECIES: Zn-ribbon domain-containing OB-fold protein [Erythrobacteraceae]|jgi:uncharacterized OB-fold protein|uniref:ChsH2 C-terminal OB-fold domain-containing protein n=2 Tax=Erythrobacteraceae TaxID=335929 RepID=A0A844ZGC1_9SPHN|nr:OB-fold domain-containing protein [Erythrobacter sp.]MBY8332410.1 OB-fold domain-containing protein [Qipengyuania pacifica]MXO86030.1 hypothetical protein [Parapontixanthobacter aurantiacus]RIV83609.1 hypothetical protein D2V07_15985 [Aurantiacibacter zhengii]|tara:strand:- start:1089 stop:1493 length:405 start_codon:yes stop_codon:yes gene_type:complete